MAPNLNASRNRKGGSTAGKYTPRENVAVQVALVHSTDPKTPTPADDYIEAFLLHDAYGLKAEFDGDGVPLTSIKAKVDLETKGRYYEGQDPTKQPTEMWDLGKGRRKGTGAKIGDNPTVILEKSRLNKQTNEVEVSFITIGQRDQNSEFELVIENVMAIVYDEKTNPENGHKKQARNIFLVEEAVEVNSMDTLKAAILSKLEDNRADRSFAMIHLVGREVQPIVSEKDEDGNTQPQYPYQAISYRVSLGYDSENKVSLEPAASVEAWFADEQNADDIATIEICLDPEQKMMVEVIGGFSYPTGKNSLPSAKGRMSDHLSFQAPWENPETGAKGVDRTTGNPYVMQGVARGHMVLGRVDGEDGPGNWYAKDTFVTRSFDPLIYRDRELITKNTPPEIAAVFEAQATRRAAEKVEFFNKRRDAAKEPEDKIKQESDDNFDPSGGMQMGR